MTQEAILEKVQKLLIFQKGAEDINSLEEAANAAEKIQALLIKHNLELSDIDRLEEKHEITRHDHEDIRPKKNEGGWIFALYGGLARYNLCKLIIINMRAYKYISLIGSKENTEVVKYLGQQLEVRVRDMEKEAWGSMRHHVNEKRGAFRRGYLMGAARGIEAQLKIQADLQQRANENVTTLVVMNSEALDEAINREFNRVKQGTTSRLTGYAGHNRGFQDGKSMDINKEKRIS